MRGLLLRSSFSSLLLFRKSPPFSFPFPFPLLLSSSAPFSSDSNSNSKLNIFDRQLKRIQVPTYLPLSLIIFPFSPLSLNSIFNINKINRFVCHCVGALQRDRAAWLMPPNDPLLDTVAHNLLDRLQVPTSLFLSFSL